ncbi:MAG: DUF4258 domain-containing protein, partial [Candidatus Nanohaloarchaea archaeon]|nr:DUF4258 domain-containing protein [Candidatus Nanohaloarchaea archaeon]
MPQDIRFTLHAEKRMREYGITRETVVQTVNHPDSEVEGRKDRTVAQKRLDGKILRAIYEENEGIKTVVTTYRAEADR